MVIEHAHWWESSEHMSVVCGLRCTVLDLRCDNAQHYVMSMLQGTRHCAGKANSHCRSLLRTNTLILTMGLPCLVRENAVSDSYRQTTVQRAYSVGSALPRDERRGRFRRCP